MKLSTEPFLKQLTQKTLAPYYWLSGDEPLQQQECHQALIDRAKKLDFLEHQRLDISSLDQSQLNAEFYATSLFAEKRIIEIGLSQGKLSEVLAAVLLAYCQKPNPHVILILTSPKLEVSASASRAVKAFEENGVMVQCWPMTSEQLPQWLSARLAKYGLSTSLTGLKCLADLVEGNLLYAAQSIEKLSLSFPSGTNLTPEQLLHAVAPQAYFDIFQLNEAFLAGDQLRALKICRNLRATGVEIILVWGALMKDIRLLIKLSLMNPDKNFSEACQKLGVWEKRKPLYRKALQQGRHRPAMLKAMADIDQLIKGQQSGDPWLSLERFLLAA